MKKWSIIIIGFIWFVALVAVVWQRVYVKTATMQEVFILPQNFKGVVLIAYDQRDGLEDREEDGKLIYKIPQKGVLKLKRKLPTTLSQTWYYFEDVQGKRTQFYYCFEPKEMKENEDKVYAFGLSNGGFEADDGQEIRTTTF